MAKVIVVLPTYNERDNLEALVKKILESYLDVDVLVVDDDSPDGTGKIADSLAEKDSRVEVLHRSGRSGLASAYRDGFKRAVEKNSEYIVQMDADFSHDPRYIQDFFKDIADCDVVVGSRYVKGGDIEDRHLIRNFISDAGRFYANLICGIKIKDSLGGFKCFKAECIKKLLEKKIWVSSGYLFQLEVNLFCKKNGYKIKEIPIIFHDRKRGKTKMSLAIIFEAFFKVWLLPFFNN